MDSKDYNKSMNIKKMLVVLLFVFAFAFVACGEEQQQPQDEPKVNVAEESVELEVGEDKVVVPEKSEGAVLEWSTSDDKVATVNNGKILAVGEGTCVITVTVQGTEVKDQINVTVNKTVILVESVEVKGVNALSVNKTQIYAYVATPANAEVTEVKWSVSDTSIATIDNMGALTALKEGTVKVICEVNGVKGELEVTVNPPQPVEPTKIDLYVNGELIEDGQTINITEFDTAQLTFEYYPKDAPVLEGVDISSGSEYILSVNEDNVITALAPGQTYLVICSTYAALETSYNVVVAEKHFLPESVTVTGTATEIMAGQFMNVSATVLPERAADDVVWSSSDPSIATVDENGVVTGVKAGTVKIIATTPEVETVKGEYEITVTAAPEVSLGVMLVCPAGTDNIIEYEGNKYYKGLNMFENMADAFNKVEEGGKVIFLAGEYTLKGRPKVTKTMTVLGPNADKKMGEERVAEAVINIDGESTDTNALEIYAANVTFNGLKFASQGRQAHVFLCGEVLENFAVKSCYYASINTPLETLKSTTFKGTLLYTDCYFDRVLQFIAWFKDGDKIELSEFNILNCKFYGENESYASRGALSLRTATAIEGFKVNFKYNEVDLSKYNHSSSEFGTTNAYFLWVNTGTFNMEYNVFKGFQDDRLLNADMSKTTNVVIDNNLFLDANDNVIANPKLGGTFAGTNNFESLDKFNEALSKVEK